jgi:uncharacterized protein (TIGR02145 family)
LLYNWYAATGRNFDDTNSTEEAQTTAVAGQNEVENLYGKVQGICPDGWYLPSDRDWNVLEKHFFDNTGAYDQYDSEDISLIRATQNQWDPAWDIVLDQSFRGVALENNHLGHAGSMKEACPLFEKEYAYVVGTRGYSLEPKLKGFNITLPGWIKPKDGQIGAMAQRDRLYIGVYWASSQHNGNDGWHRFFHTEHSRVGKSYAHKVQLESVRCKKQ